jgi:tetratricopeptide (TPR) repeat protein
MRIASVWTTRDPQRYLESALSICQTLDDEGTTAKILGNQASFHLFEGDHATAERLFRQSLEIARRCGDRTTESHRLGNLGLLHLTLGQYRSSCEYLRQAIKIAVDIGSRWHEAMHLGNLGLALSRLGNLEEGEACLRRAIQISGEIEHQHMAAAFESMLAVVFRDSNRDGGAERLVRNCLQVSRDVGDLKLESTQFMMLATLAVRTGDFEEAIAFHQSAYSVGWKSGAPKLVIRALVEWARVCRLNGAIDHGAVLLQRVKPFLERYSDHLTQTIFRLETGHHQLIVGHAPTPTTKPSPLWSQPSWRSYTREGQLHCCLERAVAVFNAGEPLYRGQCLEDFPESVREQIRRAAESVHKDA